MLSKCANPACGAKFQYLHVGRVFVIEYRNSTDRLRYFWLCSDCSRSMTIQTSGAGGVRIAPARSVLHGSGPQSSEGLTAEAGELIPGPNPVWGHHMLSTKHKLGALVKELEFLDSGGYRLVMGWRPPLVFEDSPICPKPPCSACLNTQCVLLDFVLEEHRVQTIPCRHNPLNQIGETLHTLYNKASMEEIEKGLREWLTKKIAELEQASREEAILVNRATGLPLW